MILDGHIHITGKEGKREDFADKLKAAGVDGGVVLSMPPRRIRSSEPMSVAERLDNLFYWTDVSENVYPFYFIDPTDDDATEQAHLAVERGVYGFKIGCSRHDPGDERAMKTYQAIADAGKPILFHSGILYDGRPSAEHNRPAKFEALLGIKGLKFALAHISWPWCDECIAVFGKFWNSNWMKPELGIEMFIDVTPGTPPVRRPYALEGVVGYPNAANSAFFGTDGRVNDYGTDNTREYIRLDTQIYDSLGLDKEGRNKIFSENLLRFIGVA